MPGMHPIAVSVQRNVPYSCFVFIPLAVLALGSIASIVALSLGPVLIVLNETMFAALASILPNPLDSKAILKSLVASGFMALVMEALQLLYYSRFLLPVYLLVGLLAYLLALRTLKVMSKADIDLLRRILGPRFSRICDLLSWLVIPQ